jgi:uncharacterized protein YwgA
MSESDKELDSVTLLMMLLYAPGSQGRLNEPIRGRTRLQKLLFLLYEEGKLKGIVKDRHQYIPHKAGPFSTDVLDSIEFLRQLGLVKDFGYLDQTDEVQDFLLSPKGVEVARKMRSIIDDRIWKTIEAIKSEYNSMDLNELLRYIYARYPEYAIHSEAAL